LIYTLTRKEYMTLLDIFQIADWIFSAHKVEERTNIDKFYQQHKLRSMEKIRRLCPFG